MEARLGYIRPCLKKHIDQFPEEMEAPRLDPLDHKSYTKSTSAWVGGGVGGTQLSGRVRP